MTQTVTLSPQALTTLERVKQQGFGINPSDPTQDDAIRFLINRASRRIIRRSGREFKTTTAQTTATDGAMSASSGVLTSASAAFATGDVGKAIIIYGAGIGGDALQTTIASRQSATQVTLTASAGTTVAAATYTYSGATRTLRIQSNQPILSSMYDQPAAVINFGEYDAQTISSVVVETQTTGGSYTLDPTVPQYQAVPIERWFGVYTGIEIGGFFTNLPGMIGLTHTAQVTGVWGWPSVPEDIEAACIEQVKLWHRMGYAVLTPSGIPGEVAGEISVYPPGLANSVAAVCDEYAKADICV